MTSDVPFVSGGHRVIAHSLVSALRERGFESELCTTPQNRFGRQASAYLATRWTDLELTGDGFPVDQIISLRFPSYAARHPRHVCWLNHRMREYYDRWASFSATLGRAARLKETARRFVIRRIDDYLLRRVTRLLAQSRNVQNRLRRWGGLEADVVYPPPPPRAYRTEAYDPFILFVGRLHPLKRPELLLEALARLPGATLRGVWVGQGELLERLRDRAAALGLGPRVELRGWVDEAELVELYARCRAVVYPPVDEDYGLVTLEAFRSRKPLVTARDSGGPTELVRDGDNGFVIEPEVEALASALGRLASESGLAQRLGERGYEAARPITWEAALQHLVLR
ncbi:MAG TPA: glycosyltransferase family 4 protein [Acidobacteriota bacterium]